MKKIIIFLILFSFNVFANTYINEINYDPAGNDNNFEYVEMYSDELLDNLTLRDLKSEDKLSLVRRTNSNYYLIVEEGFNYGNLDCNIFSAGATIGSNLNNDRDSIVIEDNNTILDVISYSDKYGGNGNGKTLCKIPDLIGVLKECIPSPCKENSNNVSYKLNINEIMPDPEGDDNAAIPDGEWIEVYNYEDYNISLEGFYMEDLFGHRLFISKTNTENTIIEPKGYLVVYANGFSGLLNNEDFEEVKLFSNEGNLIDKVSYGNSKEGVSWSKINKKWVMSIPTPGKDNPKKEKDVELNSKISIEKVYLGSDEKAKFGDNVQFKVNIYKGDTSKQSIEAWIRNGKNSVTKKAKINVEKRFFEYPITLSLQLDPNCKKEYKEGKYELIVKGLDTEDSKDIKISGLNTKLCDQYKIKETLSINKSLLEYTPKEDGATETDLNAESFDEITGNTIYLSSSEKQRNIGLYLFSFLMIVILMYVLVKKND